MPWVAFLRASGRSRKRQDQKPTTHSQRNSQRMTECGAISSQIAQTADYSSNVPLCGHSQRMTECGAISSQIAQTADYSSNIPRAMSPCGHPDRSQSRTSTRRDHGVDRHVSLGYRSRWPLTVLAMLRGVRRTRSHNGQSTAGERMSQSRSGPWRPYGPAAFRLRQTAITVVIIVCCQLGAVVRTRGTLVIETSALAGEGTTEQQESSTSTPTSAGLQPGRMESARPAAGLGKLPGHSRCLGRRIPIQAAILVESGRLERAAASSDGEVFSRTVPCA